MLTRQLCKSARENKVIPVTWCIMMISKLYSVLFSTFWLLFILELEPSRQKAQQIYQYVMIVSIVCGVAFVPLVGKLADNYNPQIVLPLSCITRFLACVGFAFI